MGQLDMKALRVLASILETRSVTRTAEDLRMSQPAVSRALDLLRKALNDRLVVRTGGVGVLTPRARELIPLVSEAIFALARVFKRATFDPAGSRGTVRVATTDYGNALVLAPVCAAIAAIAPGITTEAIAWNAQTVADLAEGRLDIALYVEAEVPLSGDFHVRDLFEDTFACLVRSNHPIFAMHEPDGQINRKALARFPRVLMTFPDGRRMDTADFLTGTLGAPAPANHATPYFLGSSRLVEQSDVVLCTTPRLARLLVRPGASTIIELPDAPTYTYRMAWHASSNGDQMLKWMRECILRYGRDTEFC